MEKIIMVFAFMGLIGIQARAQVNRSGIYLNFNDFKNNQLSYTNTDGSGTNKIHFHEFSNRGFITIKHNGEKTYLSKNEIYGYRLTNGQVTRIWEGIPYLLTEQRAIWIYYRDMDVSKGKGIQRGRKYFYSMAGNSEIIPLTIDNLKHSFPDKYLFQNFLDAQFSNDGELSLYDRFAKEFKVNRLLETTTFATAKN